MSYQEAWAPASMEQAQFLIDTTREGEAFWAEGAALAATVMADAPPATEVVVEYGCGVGRIIGQVRAPHRIGVDVSAEMLALAAERFPEVEYRPCDGASIPLEDGSACFVFSILVLQHMDAADVAAVVADVGRVLRPGGRAWLSFSAFGSEWSLCGTVARGPLNWNGTRAGSSSPAHATLAYTPEIIHDLAVDGGLHVSEIRPGLLDDRVYDYTLIAEAA